jgi:hypothetical protein
MRIEAVPVPVPQWRIENFSTLTDARVRSECFEAGIGTWCVGRLRADAAIARCFSRCADCFVLVLTCHAGGCSCAQKGTVWAQART